MVFTNRRLAREEKPVHFGIYAGISPVVARVAIAQVGQEGGVLNISMQALCPGIWGGRVPRYPNNDDGWRFC